MNENKHKKLLEIERTVLGEDSQISLLLILLNL